MSLRSITADNKLIDNIKFNNPELFQIAVTMGSIPGLQILSIRGRNDDVIPLSTPEHLSLNGSASFLPGEAIDLQIVSTDEGDVADGVGCPAFRVDGLAFDASPITEIVNLNGTAPVDLSNQFWRVNNMIAYGSPGASGSNVGDVLIYQSGSSENILKSAAAGDGLDSTFTFTVPKDLTAMLGSFFVSLHTPNGDSVSTKQAELTLRGRYRGGCWLTLAKMVMCDFSTTQVLSLHPYPPSYPEGTDFQLHVTSVGTGGSLKVGVSVGHVLYLINNNLTIL